MRRPWAALSCAVVLLLAGCTGFTAGRQQPPPETETPQVFTLQVGEDANGTAEGNPDQRDGPAPDDPETDRLGWEGGYWHNETLNVSNRDGLTEAERAAVVNRSMARVEYVRGLEFSESVPVETVSRERFRANVSRNYTDSLRTFDNAKFEALFLVGEGEDSIAAQEGTLGESVLGYYSPEADRIVLVSDTETPAVAEGTLAHELVHALQDQRFGIGDGASTRDGRQGRNGLVEGDASAVEDAYRDRCGDEWDCLAQPTAARSGGSGDVHFGISYLTAFPYTDGVTFVAALRDRGGWAAVDDAYDDVPESSRAVTEPSDYPEWTPTAVTVPEPPGSEWDRVEPEADYPRPDYATLGPSAIAAAQVHTLRDEYNTSATVVDRAQVYTNDAEDPYNYALNGTRGWAGGRLAVYSDGDETAYVWRTAWRDEASAAAFADAWAAVVEHYGGTEVAPDTWVIEESSPYADAVAVHVDGARVTVVNAPTEAELSGVYDA